MVFVSPKQVLKELKLRKDMVAADFGCGSGSWTLALAEKTEDGKVYAIDVLEEPLSALASKAKAKGLANIETILADVEKSSKLENESCDLVLMTDLLFQTENNKSVLEEGKRRGNILVVDWKRDAVLGPKEGHILPEEIKKNAGDLGLKLKKEFEAGAYHFALIFEK
jgi:ubiquinone/menaquinone biosynthesis C-methylase UbiE